MKTAVKITVLSVISLLLLFTGTRHYYETAYPRPYADIIEPCADSGGVSPSLVYAIIRAESNFDPLAVSEANARGLMQLMPDTFAWVYKRECSAAEQPPDIALLFDPETNIRCGIALFQWLLTELTVTETALAAYNAGIGHVREWLSDPRYSADGKTLTAIPFPETERYVRRVTSIQKQYQRLYGLP